MKTRLSILLAAALSIPLAGCVHLFPLGRVGEVKEAMALFKSFSHLDPETRDLLLQEHEVANDLKITLDELAKMERSVFQQKFRSYLDRFVAIRNRRRQILDTIGQGVWQSPMVFVVQHKAMQLIRDDILRTENWIRFAQNVQLRAELRAAHVAETGAEKQDKQEFPEFAALSHQLEGFLASPVSDPLGPEMRDLQEEFRFGEGESD